MATPVEGPRSKLVTGIELPDRHASVMRRGPAAVSPVSADWIARPMRLSGFRSVCIVAAGGEVVGAFLWRIEVEDAAFRPELAVERFYERVVGRLKSRITPRV